MPVDIKNVLVCDAVDSACVDLLKSNGINVTYKLKLAKEQLCEEVKNYDAVIVRSDTKITEEVLNAGSAAAGGSLKAVGRAGAGVDNIDVAAATKQNVIVLNTPGGNSISACELTCMLIGALARPFVPAGQSMKEGRWDRKLYSGTELYGKTLAILGLGRIGREVAIRMQAWGMKIIGYDPITTDAEAKAAGIEKMTLEQIWPLADYITVHTPLIPATRNLINAQALGKCKKGVKVVNVARGGIIDESAVLAALESGQCGGAAFDVFPEEPPKSEITKALIQHPKVVSTPHLGASTSEAQVRVAVEVAEQFIALTGKSKEYTTYAGVINRDVLKVYQ
ncbi:D-3-phosphoglycerate dehydrogenase [Episyrphus balteatus]|uniref:D-3-phosphoglycerate dehydrogenase n=1 Tax=Episyrphus balteatus TaxID=286459 RepID=UPI00248670F8|nr:D-3-phosphoglycerate dehydrogenase [Episyrphus balteatus]